ncbi:hypothetical protein C1880_07005 [Senegalimassilia anaerobia]|uniref:Uncharacterized protein n=2 Tax=Senegalimassilia anaerobia TaxID=1473216 RepID=A0A369L6Q3_9ACTN|nr:hypothetical protein C1880_07005 [Senegalimassilia anaerobia]
MVAGHSWNVAASSIDEKVGQMEGYTSIVYAGTLPVQADAKTLDSQNGSDAQLEDGVGSADAAEKADEGASGSGSTSASPTSSDAAASASSSGGSVASSSADENASVSGGSSSTGSSNPSSKSSSSKAASGQTKSSDSIAVQTHNDEASGLTSDVGSVAAPVPDTSEQDDSESDRTSDNATVLKAATVRGGMDVAKSQPVAPEQVQANYEEKGATVLVLDTADPSQYSDGVILKRGSKRIGVFSVDVPLSEKAAEARVKYFRDCKVDLVVCISSVRTYVRNLQGADIVITLQDEEVSTMGGNSNGSFFVNAPHVDSVGAILVSPSNVVSAKVIESL